MVERDVVAAMNVGGNQVPCAAGRAPATVLDHFRNDVSAWVPGRCAAQHGTTV